MSLKRVVYNATIKNIEDKIPDITNLATNASLNSKINEVKDAIPRNKNELLLLLLLLLKIKHLMLVI